MAIQYSRDTIIKLVREYFETKGFECSGYDDEKWGDVRIPLYGKLSEEDNVDEIVIDVIVETKISKGELFRTIDGVKWACSVRFFQHYIPTAKVYWAYGAYITKDQDYEDFRDLCKENGIGLLEVSMKRKEKVKIIEEAVSIFQGSREVIQKTTSEIEQKDELARKITRFVEKNYEGFIRQLVYYGNPKFQRQEILDRKKQFLSLVLIDELQSIKNLNYKDVLVRLSKSYRDKASDDYDIALEMTKSLWEARLGVKYPVFQELFEPILLLNRDYRDHFLHEFQVFLLGAVIIDRLYGIAPIQSFSQLYNTKIEDAWLAAATYHDYNYVIQDYDDWMKKLFEHSLHFDEETPVTVQLGRTVIRDNFVSKVQSLCDAIGCNIDDSISRYIFEKAVHERHHAALGALTFLSKFHGKGRLSPEAKAHIASSILLHDDKIWSPFCGKSTCSQHWEASFSKKRLIPKLEFDKFPLEFLLAYCDVAQEWGRVGRGYASSNAELVNIEIDNSKILVRISIEDLDGYRYKKTEIEKYKEFMKDTGNPKFGIQLQSPINISRPLWMNGK